jgi:hypothetical protein
VKQNPHSNDQSSEASKQKEEQITDEKMGKDYRFSSVERMQGAHPFSLKMNELEVVA